jgi:hypothetical protein
MTEREWLTSEDPAAMLRLVMENPDHQEITCCRSERKLRLFACACFRRNATGLLYQQAVATACEAWADGGDRPFPEMGEPDFIIYDRDAHHAARDIVKNCSVQQAELLRDIAGNPFRPAVLPKNPPHCPHCGSARFAPVPLATRNDIMACKECYWQWEWSANAYACPWLTPTVVSLAQAAYDHQGRQWVGRKHDQDEATGWVEDGHLDSVRLSVLADALEEAGYPAVEREQCSSCDGVGWYNETGPNTFSQTCHSCVGNGTRSWDSPLLVHLRSPGPHVRGCWALDLLLGKE